MLNRVEQRLLVFPNYLLQTAKRTCDVQTKNMTDSLWLSSLKKPKKRWIFRKRSQTNIAIFLWRKRCDFSWKSRPPDFCCCYFFLWIICPLSLQSSCFFLRGSPWLEYIFAVRTVQLQVSLKGFSTDVDWPHHLDTHAGRGDGSVCSIVFCGVCLYHSENFLQFHIFFLQLWFKKFLSLHL